MATVYLAEDLKHARKVAIKLLHPELSAVIGAERFLAEIRTTANLQHPHILPLFDSGSVPLSRPESDSREGERPGRISTELLFYVMPLIDGETLRSRLVREKQLPVHDAVRIAREVASALDYAHRHGVIHRDIKPENILLHDGQALVADFGIALAASRAGGERMTQTGMSLGTPQYMSPEQALGEREIGARSDVFALGAVTYEMLTGDPPFAGSTAQAIVAQVVTEAPRPLRPKRHTIPPHVEQAVLTALEKLPADRWGSAQDFADALGDARPAQLAGLAHTRATALASRAPTAALGLAIAALGALAAWGWLRPRPAAAVPPIYRFNVMLPMNAAWVGDILSLPALSPDGTLLAYTGRDSTDRRWLYLRAMDRRDPVPVPGAEGGANPFFSPDGREVAFILGTRLVRAPVTGGTPTTVCESGNARGTWLERNTVVYTDRHRLVECNMSGQSTTLLAGASAETFTHVHALPGDRAVLFGIQRGAATELAAFDLGTSRQKLLGIKGSNPRYVATGHLVYVDLDRRVRAVPFDLSSLAASGESIGIDEEIGVEFGAAIMALSRTGTIVAPSTSSTERALELVDRSGRAERLLPRVGEFSDPRFSPDGRRVVLTVGSDIWLLDRLQGALTRLSFDSSATRAVWSPDGRRVAYVRQIGVLNDLRIMNADGSAPPESLLALPAVGLWEVLFTPDGRSLVVRTAGGAAGVRDILSVPLGSVASPEPLLQSPASEVAPAVSPDGRRMAYVSNESGRAEVYVRSFPDMRERTQVSVDGGSEPAWSPRGDELFYRSGAAFWKVDARPGPAFELRGRTLLFRDATLTTDLTHRTYDVAPDGRQFLTVRNLEGRSHLKVTLNLLQNLARSGGH
jgi:serine/threonine-protein kinase